MNKSRRTASVAEYKIQASILLKSLRGNDAEKSAQRFKRLPEFADCSIADMLQDIKRKHALQVIAVENGFDSWSSLKMQINFIVGGHLNLWFTNYSDAKTQLQIGGGFLLPYKKQFFICDADYLRQIGFAPDDPEWQLIEYDWVNPRDTSAWQRLYRKWSAARGDKS